MSNAILNLICNDENDLILGDRNDFDIRSNFIILRLAKRIKELKFDHERHIKRSNKWVMNEKNKSKCYNN
ncbi:hypothetical protein H5410_040591 [Solanum commersonii]|uniref:Uncharacterized protein n=1 Tax=Solanum commersonii TaxID=4109 RepID=A0A9J5XQJ5_SOLCO|nr:hypothetical protein H5410_040591 [Solanum commersonii]